MDKATVDETVRILRVLADPTRLRLIHLLSEQRPGRAFCVGALATRLGISQPAVSQHLRILRDVGLIRGERRGYRVHYFLDGERLRECKRILDSMLEWEPQAERGKNNQCDTRILSSTFGN